MERNWYAVYTKPQREKKISSLLTNKGIENFFPLNHVVIDRNGGKKRLTAPLFSSFVFVYLSESEFKLIHQMSDVNLVYWMSKPAVIQEDEIDMIKNLSANYVNLRVEKVAVNTKEQVRVLEGHMNGFLDGGMGFTSQPVKVSLPSLGYLLVAEKEKAPKEVPTAIPSSFSLFPKRLNALFTN
jgi:transcription antitermination factor NusG